MAFSSVILTEEKARATISALIARLVGTKMSTTDPASARTPSEQVIVTLFDLPCLAVRDADGSIYVAVVDLCSPLGVKATAQPRRIQRHEHLNAGLVPFRLRRGNRIEVVQCLHLQLTAGWLVQISTARVREEVRERLRFLQLHLLDAVWQAFATLTGLPQAVEQIEDLQDIDRIDEALRNFEDLARRQVVLEESQERARGAWRQMQERLRELAGRVAELEQRVGGRLSPAQRGHLYHLVQAWATARAQKATSLSREAVHAACWGEIKTRFGPVARYEDMSPAQYSEAVVYIKQQYRTLTGQELELPEQGELPL